MTSGPSSAPDTLGDALPGSSLLDRDDCAPSAMAAKWSALHDAASVVAALAGLAAEPLEAEGRDFPTQIRDANGWAKTLAEQGIDDLAAVMEPGIAALLAAHARGATAASAALALWHEFARTRAAVLAVTGDYGTATLPRA